MDDLNRTRGCGDPYTMLGFVCFLKTNHRGSQKTTLGVVEIFAALTRQGAALNYNPYEISGYGDLCNMQSYCCCLNKETGEVSLQHEPNRRVFEKTPPAHSKFVSTETTKAMC